MPISAANAPYLVTPQRGPCYTGSYRGSDEQSRRASGFLPKVSQLESAYLQTLNQFLILLRSFQHLHSLSPSMSALAVSRFRITRVVKQCPC